MNDLSQLATGPDLVLAPASDIRARGEQRTRRTRASLAGAAALVVAAAGTAVALAGADKPDALVPTAPTPTATAEPTPTPSAPAPGYGPPVTFLSFPTLERVGQTIPGEWLVGPVQEYDGGAVVDRCDPSKADDTNAGTWGRSYLTTDGASGLAMTVHDFGDALTAASVLHGEAAGFRRCPVVTVDGAGLGSKNTATLQRSTSTSYVVQEVQRECHKSYADCRDTTTLHAVVRSGHLIAEVRWTAPSGTHQSDAALDELAHRFAEQARSSYGATGSLPPFSASAPVIGRTYYAAVLGASGTSRLLQASTSAALAGEENDLRTLPARCLDGMARQVPSIPTAKDTMVAVLFFADAATSELWADSWNDDLEGVAKVTVRCLT